MSVIEDLLALQELDCRIRALEQELKDLPLRIKAEESRLEEHKAAVASAETVGKHHMAETKKLDLECESHREKIRKLRQQQADIKTNKEFKALESEIRTIEQAIKAVEDKQLVFMESIEKATFEVSGQKKLLADEDASVKRDVKVWAERKAAIEAELQTYRTRRQAEATKLPEDWLGPYDRIFSRRDRALVPVEEGGVCGGCHMQLPPYLIHGARKREAMVACGQCGRLLY